MQFLPHTQSRDLPHGEAKIGETTDVAGDATLALASEALRRAQHQCASQPAISIADVNHSRTDARCCLCSFPQLFLAPPGAAGTSGGSENEQSLICHLQLELEETLGWLIV